MADAERSEGAATTATTDPEAAAFDYDVAIVGDGPTGCSAGIFTGRYSLYTVTFDCGRSSLQRRAYLENRLGFPGSVDVETFYELVHDHAEVADCGLVPALVEAAESVGGNGTETADTARPDFKVMTQSGETVTARRIVAAARYGSDLLEPLDDDEIFVIYECDGETRTKFDRDYADIEGRVTIDGLYAVASMSEINVRVIMSAGQGARVSRSIITDHRPERGYPKALAHHWDWIRPESKLADEETARDDWRKRLDSRVPDDYDLAKERFRELHGADVERQRGIYIPEKTVEARVERGRERFADHLDVAADSVSDSKW